MGIKTIPLSGKELEYANEFCKFVVGEATCPFCGQTGVKVENDHGYEGNQNFNYLTNHFAKGSIKLCEGSERMLNDL